MGFNRHTALAQAFLRAAIEDEPSLDGKSKRWIARNVADKIIHAERNYMVHESDHRPTKNDGQTQAD